MHSDNPSTSLYRRIVALVSSNSFLWLIVAGLALQSAWIALSGRYPMAFDEDFHLGIIRIYAHHLSPFLAGQPKGADQFGAVATDPSYLYQYLMSFPYRLISLFTNDQTIQVIFLRFIDIILMCSSLPLYRRLLLRLGLTRATAHTCLTLCILVPVLPLLAAQINYDDLLLPLTAICLLLTLDVTDTLRAAKTIDLKKLSFLVMLCLLSSLVKYEFIPIFFSIVLFLGFEGFRANKKIKLFSSLTSSVRLLSRKTVVGLVVGIVLCLGLFGQRYAVNFVRYHQAIPDCGQVLSVQQCSAYGPWIRDYDYQINKVQTSKNPVTFTLDWFYGMWLRLYFAVDGPGTDFQTRGPFFVPAVSTIVFTVVGAGLLGIYSKRLWLRNNRHVLVLFGITIVIYVAALWLDEYRSYVRTGQPVAINGRYLFPIMPLFVGILATGYYELLRTRYVSRIALASFMVVCMLCGGGALTYILRSNSNWYFPNQLVDHANYDVQQIIGPIIPGNSDPTAFLH